MKASKSTENFSTLVACIYIRFSGGEVLQWVYYPNEAINM